MSTFLLNTSEEGARSSSQDIIEQICQDKFSQKNTYHRARDDLGVCAKKKPIVFVPVILIEAVDLRVNSESVLANVREIRRKK